MEGSPPPSSGGSAPAPAPATKNVGDTTKNVGGAPPAGAPETPAAKKARLFKVKVDGVESDLDLDKMSDEEHVKNAQWARAAQKRIAEAAEVKKSFQNIIEQIKKDPFAALKDKAFGELDLRKLAEDRLVQEYQESQMPEHDRKAADLQRQLEAERGRVKDFETKAQQQQQSALEERVFQETQRDFIQALDAADLPKTKETLYAMAQIASVAFENGVEMSPGQLAQEVQRRQVETHQRVTRGLKGEKLMAHLGPDVVREVRDYLLAKAKGQNPNAPKPPTNQPDATDTPERPARKMADFKAASRFFKIGR